MNLEHRELSSPRLYIVTIITNEGPSMIESTVKPLLGGYRSTKKYGDPNYCPSATRHHKKAMKETGQMKNLIYFDSVETAVACGYSPCGSCWTKGEEAFVRWQEYKNACSKLGITPISEPIMIRKKI